MRQYFNLLAVYTILFILVVLSTVRCSGDNGAGGPTGPLGPQGEQGEQGEQGASGPAGQDGADGQDGEDGSDAESPTVTVLSLPKHECLALNSFFVKQANGHRVSFHAAPSCEDSALFVARITYAISSSEVVTIDTNKSIWTVILIQYH